MPLPDSLDLQDLGGEFPAPGEGVLLEDFAIQEQEQRSWCWAAVTMSVHQFYKGKSFASQCGLATEVLKSLLSGGSCCPAKANPKCERKLLSQTALLAAKNLAKPPQGRHLEFDEIVAEINDSKTGRPICCTRMGNDAAGAHIVAMTGWDVTPEGERRVFIQNPNGPETMWHSYDEFVMGKERSWVATFLTKSGDKTGEPHGTSCTKRG